MSRPINVIANEIENAWSNVNPYAKPYLNAMKSLSDINDKYILDSADMVVRYFLSNARSFRGDMARELKAELKAMLK